MIMKCLRKILPFLLLLTAVGKLNAGNIVVIINRDNPLEKLTRHQVVDLYMGRQLVFADGTSALPLDQAMQTRERAVFYRKLLNKRVAEINAYWARLLFTGRATPPRSMNNSEEILRTVRNNPSAIGYIDEDHLDQTVKVVFRLE